MLASEAIARIQELIAEYGDQEITLLSGDAIRAIRFDDSEDDLSGTFYVSNIGA